MNEVANATGGNVLVLPGWAAGILSFLLLSIVSLIVATWTRMEKRLEKMEIKQEKIPTTYQTQEKCGFHLSKLDSINHDADDRLRALERTVDRCPNCSKARE